MTGERAAREAWGLAIANRVEHQDTCWLDGNGCSAPFGSAPVLCPAGQQLAGAEQAAYEAWTRTRMVEVLA